MGGRDKGTGLGLKACSRHKMWEGVVDHYSLEGLAMLIAYSGTFSIWRIKKKTPSHMNVAPDDYKWM